MELIEFLIRAKRESLDVNKPPLPRPYKEPGPSWKGAHWPMSHCLQSPFPRATDDQTEAGIFLTGPEPWSSRAFFFMFLKSVQCIKVAFRLLLVKLQHGKLSQSLYFLLFLISRASKLEAFLGRINGGPPPTPPYTSPTCGCRQHFTGLDRKVGESWLAEMPSTRLATKSETQGGPRE